MLELDLHIYRVFDILFSEKERIKRKELDATLVDRFMEKKRTIQFKHHGNEKKKRKRKREKDENNELFEQQEYLNTNLYI